MGPVSPGKSRFSADFLTFTTYYPLKSHFSDPYPGLDAPSGRVYARVVPPKRQFRPREAISLIEPVVLPEIGQLARPDGTPVAESDPQRRLRWLASAIAAGCTLEHVVRAAKKKFGITEAVAKADIERLADAARNEIDDEDMIELVVHSNLQRLRRRINFMGKLAEIDVDQLAGVDAHAVLDASKVAIAAAKEERAGIQVLTDLLGRRSRRWSPKSQVEVRHFDGVTPEQEEALRRIMGMPAKQIEQDDSTDAEEISE